MTSSSGPEQRARRRRVLAVAQWANPEWVSVTLVGWSHYHALSRVADVHLVTHAINAPNIVAAGLREGVEFTAIDTASVERPLRRIAALLGAGGGVGHSTETALNVLTYLEFERRIWASFGRAITAREYDVVHRLTPLSPAVPSVLAGRCRRAGVPFVLGPINGGLAWPRGFTRVRLLEREFLGYLRDVYRVLPGYRATRDNASAILVGSRVLRDELARRWGEKTVYMPENAVDPARFGAVAEPPPSPPLRVIFVGRIVAVKCVDVLVEAAAPLVRAGAVRLEIVGDGPEMASLRTIVERERLDEGVSFPGWVEHRAVHERLGRSHVFAFPSVRDFGGGAVLEGMALGLAPIVVDYGGPSELVTPTTGIRVPPGPRPALVAGFRAALERLVADPVGAREMGRRARARVLAHFTWQARAAQTLEVYRWVMGERARPDFGAPFPDAA